MSYADAVANGPQQHHPDQVLPNTTHPTAERVADDISTANIGSPHFNLVVDDGGDFPYDSPEKRLRKNASRGLEEAEAEGLHLWEITKHYLFRPGVAGGLVGLINVGLLAGAGRAFYTQPHLRRDTTIVSSTVAAALVLLSAEGYAINQYRKMPTFQEEEREAKQKGKVMYQKLHKQILQPGTLSGLIGFVNVVVVGTLGYFSYTNWDKPSWDRRTLSAITLGLLALWTGEGYLAERFGKGKHGL